MEKMKINIILMLVVFFSCGCERKMTINDTAFVFNYFPNKDSLKFHAVSNEMLDVPTKMIIKDSFLVVNTMCKSRDQFLWIYSLANNKLIKKLISYGEGPEEMLSCDMVISDNLFCLYDMTRKRLGYIHVDSCLISENPDFVWQNLNNSYYRFAMLNDTIMLGTNDILKKQKIHYVNLNSGEIYSMGEYSFLDKNLPLSALVDAGSCYINTNPDTKDIVLSYRYSDILEIYTSKGKLKYAVHGPDCFDVDFELKSNGMMGKTKNTRKAFVNSYITEQKIYLLYSGCNRMEENWSYGTRLFVFSWRGEPLKEYVLDVPIYTFAVDEKANVVYSYSVESEELVVANL